MPIQNFHIECVIDGRKSRLVGGPEAPDGGFSLTIHQRSEGKKITALKVTGIVRTDGQLALDILMQDNSLPIAFNHERILTKR